MGADALEIDAVTVLCGRDTPDDPWYCQVVGDSPDDMASGDVDRVEVDPDLESGEGMIRHSVDEKTVDLLTAEGMVRCQTRSEDGETVLVLERS